MVSVLRRAGVFLVVVFVCCNYSGSGWGPPLAVGGAYLSVHRTGSE